MTHNGPAIKLVHVILRFPAENISCFLAEYFFRPEKEGMVHFLPAFPLAIGTGTKNVTNK